jgi:hypothetical protein
MSYRSTILSDYPIAYYPLDDLTTVDIANYTSLESEYATYQDILDDPAISSYANIFGDIAYDHSGCENDSFYAGDPETDIVPIVVGNSRATKITSANSIEYVITKDYTATTTTSQFGTLTSSDNDFTLEAWIYPQFTTTNETTILADSTEDVGLFYDKGNITFKIDEETKKHILNPDVCNILYKYGFRFDQHAMADFFKESLENKPKRSIEGIVSISLHYHPFYKKKILIFGDRHNRNMDCDVPNKTFIVNFIVRVKWLIILSAFSIKSFGSTQDWMFK